MDDGGSDFSDWEVLSAAGGDGDVVLVSGEGGDVLHDHFALDNSSPADFSGEDSWSEAASYKEVDEAGLGLLDRFDSISQERMDLISVVDSSAQLQSGGVDVTAQGSVLRVFDAACGAEEKEFEALGAEIEHEEDAVGSCGESNSIPQGAHQAVEGTLDLDATSVAGVEFRIELSENSNVQLEDGGGADVNTESSVHEAAATSDATHTAQEEPVQGKDASADDESDGHGKDGSSPMVETPGTGEGERRLVVWWRLPIKLLHYYGSKVRPVWSISIAAAFLGIVVLGRRMYKMRRKTQGLPQIKIAFDDKSASQFADRTARLNEAFLIAKRVPALRTSSGAALPWSMIQER